MKVKLASKLKIILLLLLPLLSVAQPIAQYQQFNGRYDYTAIGNTLNVDENNGGSCTILTESTATLNLDSSLIVEAAYLFWAGSSPTGDFEVKLNGVSIVATDIFETTTSNSSLRFFGAFADVTQQVIQTGNGDYTFSDMDITGDIQPYCNFGVNFGGWSIIIIYEDASLPNNQVSVYIGFESVFAENPLLEFQLQNLNVVSTDGAKIGFLAWEGDAQGAVNESLQVNGIVISDPPLNPANNPFNSTNSFTGSSELWNMDLDFFIIEEEINVGDTTMDIVLTSGQDAVIVHNIVVVLSSELPDATIVVDNVDVFCSSRDIEVDYTVFNLESTDFLPANTPIAFYANETLVGTSETMATIPVGGSESNSINLTIPLAIPNDFTLKAVVDDIGDGTGIVAEINETNNDFDIEISLKENPDAGLVSTIVVCDLNDDGFATFFLPVSEIELVGTQTDITVTYYTTLANAEAGVNAITNPETYVNIVTPIQTIFVRLENNINGCFTTSSFLIEVKPVDFLPFTLNNLEFCVDGNSETGIPVNLTVQEATIFGGGDPSDYTVTYHLSQLEAAAGIAAIPNPSEYPNIVNPQLIWVRLQNNVVNCVETGSFSIKIFLKPFITDPNTMTDYELCDDEISNGFTQFNLSTKIPEITGSNPDVFTSFHTSQLNAENGVNPLPLTGYTNVSNPQTIYVRVTGPNSVCIVFTNFDLVVKEDAFATTPQAPLESCENLPESGIATFDLTQLNLEILAGQTAPDFILTYHTSLDDAEAGTNAIPSSQETQYQSPSQTIWARVTNTISSCYEIAEVQLLVNALPVPVAFLDSYRLCVDESGIIIPEEFGITSPPTIHTGLDINQHIFTWFINGIEQMEQGTSILVTQEGVYSVTIENLDTGCQNTVSTTVFLSSPPFTFSAEAINGAFASNHVIEVTATGLGNYVYQLDNGSFQSSNIFSNVNAGNHTITITDENGCGSVTLEIPIIDYPLFFTPNNDGYNDTWNIISIAENLSAKIYIFDRFGKLLIQLSPTSDGWDGNYNGKLMPSSDYWFRVDYEEGGLQKQFRGHFTLKR